MSFGFGVGDFLAAYELVSKVRQKWVDAPAEYASIRSSVRNVENVLRNLGELSIQVDINVQQRNDVEDASASCVQALEQADKIVQRYTSVQTTSKSIPGRLRRNWKRFKLDPEDIRNVRQQLTDSVTQLGGIQHNIEINMIQDITEDIDDIHLNSKAQEKAQIADWFAPSSFANQQSDQLERRHKGTANWFLQDSRYVDWRQGIFKTLFCPGIPGSGKTVIVATVINNLRQHFEQQKDVIVAYFYCNFRRQSEQNYSQMLAVLARQLFQEQSEVPNEVRQLYQSHKDRGTRPTPAELESLLGNLVPMYAQVFILVDALDECTNDDASRNKFLTLLFSLQSHAGANVSLLCTSRFIPEISSHFGSCLQIKIEAHEEDISIYLDGRMSEMCLGVRNNKLLQSDIESKITSVVDGMFLLARLHFESLQDKMSPTAVKQALRRLPNGPESLDTAYEEAMTRIEQQRKGFREIAYKVLAWIVFAREELSISMLQEAVAIEPGINDIDKESDLIDEDALVSVCAGLVTIDQDSRVVRLVHYTTQEFFERTHIQWIPDGHALVANGCINYILMPAIGPISRACQGYIRFLQNYDKISARYSLLKYVSVSWGFHASILPNESIYIQGILRDRNKLLLASKLLALETLRREPYGYSLVTQSEPDSISNLHICGFFNDVRAAAILLADGMHPNQEDSQQYSPMSWAAHRGHTAFVELLLAHPDIDVNFGSPLPAAVCSGQKEVVEILLRQPKIDVNLGHPLVMTAVYQHYEILELLLTHCDIDVNLGTPLSIAAQRGSTEAAAILVRRPDVDVNLGRPLYNAAKYGHLDTVEILVAHPNIDINLGAPLAEIARFGWEDPIRILVRRLDVDVNLGKPLYNAAAYGHPKIVKILLAHPNVDVNLGAPLAVAAFHGHQEIVTLLLRRPDIDVNLGRPLQQAAKYGYLDIVKTFLTHPNVDVNLGAPLAQAASKGHQEIVELLRAHPGIKDGV